MDPLVRRVRRAMAGLVSPSDRVAVAVSGGADSVALLHLLLEASADAGWAVSGLLHVHHGLRAAEADADERFVRDLAAEVNLPLDVTPVDVRAAMAARHQSLEAAARDLRYDAFAIGAARLGATCVATGHTADDQAETVLMRLLRGTSARGLGAIRARRGLYLRPLLGSRRIELRGYLASAGHVYREDQSNADLTVTRNRLRHTLLPAVERDWPKAVQALTRFAELSADDEQYLHAASNVVAARAIQHDAHGVQLNVEPLRHEHPALTRRVIRDAIEAAGGVPSFRDIEAVRSLLGRRSSSARLRGLTAALSGGVVLLSRTGVSGAGPFEYALPVPGSAELGETGMAIQASLVAGPQLPSSGGHPARAVLQEAALVLPLTVRSRRPGDRFRPLGAPGTRKLQDVLVDRKVPRNQRDAVPIVVDAEDRIVWVADVAIAHGCRVTAPESGMVILELMKKGNQ